MQYQLSPSQCLFSKTVKSGLDKLTIIRVQNVDLQACICCAASPSVVSQLIPEMMWPCLRPSDGATLRVAVVSILRGFCVAVYMCCSDKVAQAGGPVVLCWAIG